MDVATLQVGLGWERSDLGQRITSLQREAAKPEQKRALQEFTVQFIKTGTGDEARKRACSVVDILANETDTVLPWLEALAAAGVMVSGEQRALTLDMDGVLRVVAALRPTLREAARQAVLARCLFSFRELRDAEFEQMLEFLRSDAGGHYARGVNAAIRDTMLARTEVFTRTLLEVVRQLKGRA